MFGVSISSPYILVFVAAPFADDLAGAAPAGFVHPEKDRTESLVYSGQDAGDGLGKKHVRSWWLVATGPI
jgi:hypothetical protein